MLKNVDLDTWRQEFLSRRTSRREGDPLYAYRLQIGEFESLERVLQASLKAHPSHLAIDRLSAQGPFQACFVLYAAEWWKRRYSGGSWTWKPILDSLDVPWDTWSPNTRSQCVHDGLRRWGLQLLERAGLRFLGSVAAQGGVPLRLVQEARSQLGSMLQRLVRLGAKSSPTEADLIVWIESLADTLPRHFRQREIYELLGGMVQTTLHLAQGMGPDQRADPLAWLDAHHAGDWRQRFPVEIEDGVVRALVECLFREAITERQARPRRTHSAARYLVATYQAGTYRLCADVGLPVRIESAELAALFGIPAESLPRAATITYIAGDELARVSVRKFPGHSAYRIDAREIQAHGAAAAQAQQLEFGTELGLVGRCVLLHGERLDEDQPWIFDAHADDAMRMPLLRQGGGRFAPIEVVACLPASARVEHVPGCQWTKIGGTDDGRLLFSIRGRVNIVIGNEQFAITTQQANATNDAFEWSGSRLWEIFDVPLFQGKPELYRRALTDGMRQMRPEALGWKILGTNGPVDTPIGPVEAHWPARGDIEWRTRLVVLPPKAALRLQASGLANEGTVTLASWCAKCVVSRTEGVEISCHDYDQNLELRVRWAKAGEPAPEEIDVDFVWSNTTITTPGRLPFPGRGIVLRAAGGGLLANGDKVSLHALHGVRFLVYDARATLTLSAGGLGATRAGARRFEVAALPDARRIEIRPIDYREAIEELLTSSGRDGHVDFTTTTLAGGNAYLRVMRYSGALKPEDAVIRGIAPDATVLALRLNEIGGEPIALERVPQEGDALWVFEADRVAPGPWFVYEAPGGALQQRPLLKTIFREAPPCDSRLASAIGSGESNRRAALHDALDAMVSDSAHPDWRLAEDLARLLGHIPLTYLDLWSRFAEHPAAMAALALRREFSDSFLHQWTLHLPFLWESVPLRAWSDAAQTLRARMQGIGFDCAAITAHFHSRWESLSDHCESIRPVLHVALSPPVEGRVVRKLDPEVADAVLRGPLYQSDDSAYHRLIRNHIGEEWPRGLANEIRDAVEGWPGLKRLLPPSQHDHRDNAVRLPIILAYAAIHDYHATWLGDPNSILAMRTYRRLDPHWFQEAFAITCSRLLL